MKAPNVMKALKGINS